MPDPIDPGPGWRLLEVGEIKPEGYEWYSPWFRKWMKGIEINEIMVSSMDPCRVRISEHRTIKGIATRATVEFAFRNDAGLSDPEMDMAETYFERRADAIQKRTTTAKYIMLEIQRGPNDCCPIRPTLDHAPPLPLAPPLRLPRRTFRDR